MTLLYQLILALHALAGLVGLVAFWTPAVAKKGGAVHKSSGRIFFRAACVVAGSGLVMAALMLAVPLAAHPPAGEVTPEVAARMSSNIRSFVPFLIYLLFITFAPVYHGVRVLETRHEPAGLRTPFHTALNVAMIVMSVVMVVLAVLWRQPVFGAMSIIGFLAGPGQLQFARRPYPTRMAWWYEHMGAMIGGGIAFHTAFLVLGAGRLLGLRFEGSIAAIVWILPTLIGVPASIVWTRYYRRKFGEAERKALSTGTAVARPSGSR